LARAPDGSPSAASTPAADPASRTLAIGMLRDFREAAGAPRRPLAALLATSLARGEGVLVISAARIGEVQRQLAVGDSTEGAYASAARQAGATELVDGALYAQPDGTLRLDLRRVELATGAVRASLTVRGADLFALADSGTARLLDGMGVAGPAGSVADVTTRSAVALRLYADGLRAKARYDSRTRDLFRQSLRADPNFAMAAFEYARLDPDRARMAELMADAVRLADRATVRERLLIRAGWASTMSGPELRPVADSLVALDPRDPEALLYAAEARAWVGEWAPARALLERALAADSLALRDPSGGACHACAALAQRAVLEADAGDLDAAEEAARRWTRLLPQRADGWAALARVLDMRGRHDAAEAALEAAYAMDPSYGSGHPSRVVHLSRAGRLADAERSARAYLAHEEPEWRAQAQWQLANVHRHQGRARDALAAARGFRTLRDSIDGGRTALNHVWVPALALAEAGDADGAAALLDSIADGAVRPGEHPANAARLRPLVVAHAAELRAARAEAAQLPAAA
ncbi:hypothetical protein PYV61_25170, partial [Roseisolibacter sp. H3M3-2]